jgi:AraC-like DNA-binding protein/mannose-6-phosphate isomerase-like protein (cupin superfamily)
MMSSSNPKLETIRFQDASQTFHYYKNEAASWESFWHYHPEIEITYIHKGTGIRFVGDSIQPYEEGDLVLFGKNLPHNHISNKVEEGNQVLFGIQFSNDLFKDFRECEKINKLFHLAKYGIYFPNASQEVKQKILDIQEARPLTRLIYLLEVINEMVEDETYETLSSISFDENKDLKKHHHRINEVTTYITEHFNKNLSLDQVAGMAGLTPPSFCRWFKKNTGSTYVDYLNTIRIEKSCQYLIKTDWAIKRVAYESGFESLANFNRTFKKYKNQAPNLYRKSLTTS